MKVLIGYDGSSCSDVAIDDLQRAGLPEAGEVLVLTATDLWPAGPVEIPSALAGGPINLGGPFSKEIESVLKQKVEQAIALSRAGADRVKKLLPAWSITSETIAASSSSALVLRADSWKADLLVVGSHGHSVLGRVLLGSVAQSVLHHAQCSVRIGRCRPNSDTKREPQAPVRIVLGMDGSENSDRAAKAIAGRQWPHESEVRVVAATYVTPMELAASDNPRLATSFAKAWQESRRQLERATKLEAEYLRDEGLAATPILREAAPKQALLKEAKEWDADCIFLGARGLGGLERMLLGSVSSSVAAQAPCSVEVVR